MLQSVDIRHTSSKIIDTSTVVVIAYIEWTRPERVQVCSIAMLCSVLKQLSFVFCRINNSTLVHDLPEML